MSAEWRKLHLSQENVPPLLCQYKWTRQGYELYVTDLTTIWSERLSRKDILKRADESATTIDPSEDLDQLDLLLTKIGEAFRGDEGTTTTLNSGASTESLELSIVTKLPAPLRPLKWYLKLSREPASSTTSHLVLPLLRGEASWESRQRSLLDQLKQKDWVLGKLFDRFEALGADLGVVFPGAAGLRTARKGSSRSEAAKFIKGVAPFNEQSWLAESESSSRIVSNIIHELAGSQSGRNLESLRPGQERWWSTLQRRSGTALTREEQPLEKPTSQPKIKSKDSQGDVDLDGDETTSGSEIDEFEQQEIVPRHRAQDTKSAISPPKPKPRKKSISPQPQAVPTNEATEREPEPSPPPRRRTPTASPPPRLAELEPAAREPTKKPKKGLGVIGGQKKISERAPSPPPEPTPGPKQRPTQPEAHAPPAASPIKTKKPTRLGMIGGKAKTKAAPATETPAPESAPSPEQKPRAGPPAPPTQPITERVSPKRESAELPVPVKTSAPEETEVQRAERRREELKRQLEAKSKVPAKKKRRF